MDFKILQEYEVINAVLRKNAAGKSVEQIAAFLSVSPHQCLQVGPKPGELRLYNP